MHIALISFYAVRNVGDKILTECVKEILVRKGHAVQIVDIQGREIISERDSEEEKRNKAFRSELTSNNHELLVSYFENKVQRSDLVIFAGGAIIDVLSERLGLGK